MIYRKNYIRHGVIFLAILNLGRNHTTAWSQSLYRPIPSPRQPVSLTYPLPLPIPPTRRGSLQCPANSNLFCLLNQFRVIILHHSTLVRYKGYVLVLSGYIDENNHLVRNFVVENMVMFGHEVMYGNKQVNIPKTLFTWECVKCYP